MIAVDTNILVYAHRRDSPFYEEAYRLMRGLAQGKTQWGIPWPCLYEFVSIVTNQRIFKNPTPVDAAASQAAAWLSSPSAVLLSEGIGYWEVFEKMLLRSKVTGPKIHDLRIAALCTHHDIDELLTADRDFSRFVELKCRNPL